MLQRRAALVIVRTLRDEKEKWKRKGLQKHECVRILCKFKCLHTDNVNRSIFLHFTLYRHFSMNFIVSAISWKTMKILICHHLIDLSIKFIQVLHGEF